MRAGNEKLVYTLKLTGGSVVLSSVVECYNCSICTCYMWPLRNVSQTTVVCDIRHHCYNFFQISVPLILLFIEYFSLPQLAFLLSSILSNKISWVCCAHYTFIILLHLNKYILTPVKIKVMIFILFNIISRTTDKCYILGNMVLHSVWGPSLYPNHVNDQWCSLVNVRKAKKDSVSCWHFPDGEEDTMPCFKTFSWKNVHH